jgi:protein-L-isoaspartate(D-aspartate) O-methyltransferase
LTDIDLQGLGMTSQRTRERLIRRLMDQGISDSTVLDVMRNIPRHLFLDEALAHRAYEDIALPIGHGQTLSQPFIVARMTEALVSNARQLNKVLEIGTGSGYQTAILAKLVNNLYTVERIRPLLDKARQRMNQLKLNNVNYRLADGNLGWPNAGPYDAILSAAAPATIPDKLKQQLAPNGVLIIPVGIGHQDLMMIVRVGESSEFCTEVLAPVRFVPLLKGVVC